METKAKRREELEKLLEFCPDSNEYVEEEGGVFSKKVTPLHTYQLMRAIGHRQQVQGQFLLYLDDRITEQNGYHSAINNLQKQVEKICSDRDVTCPVAPLVKNIGKKISDHLDENRDERLIKDERTRWQAEGQMEERHRFERALKVLGAGILVLTTATGLVTWFLGIWG